MFLHWLMGLSLTILVLHLLLSFIPAKSWHTIHVAERLSLTWLAISNFSCNAHLQVAGSELDFPALLPFGAVPRLSHAPTGGLPGPGLNARVALVGTAPETPARAPSTPSGTAPSSSPRRPSPSFEAPPDATPRSLWRRIYLPQSATFGPLIRSPSPRHFSLPSLVDVPGPGPCLDWILGIGAFSRRVPKEDGPSGSASAFACSNRRSARTRPSGSNSQCPRDHGRLHPHVPLFDYQPPVDSTAESYAYGPYADCTDVDLAIKRTMRTTAADRRARVACQTSGGIGARARFARPLARIWRDRVVVS